MIPFKVTIFPASCWKVRFGTIYLTTIVFNLLEKCLQTLQDTISEILVVGYPRNTHIYYINYNIEILHTEQIYGE